MIRNAGQALFSNLQGQTAYAVYRDIPSGCSSLSPFSASALLNLQHVLLLEYCLGH